MLESVARPARRHEVLSAVVSASIQRSDVIGMCARSTTVNASSTTDFREHLGGYRVACGRVEDALAAAGG
ncbi:hypothetical protein [Mycobacteroides abscessus]|uniref:hypothetical protein n=1 Tax=Mycobacteroides abscessus TaxID=36809 RepID=UPI001F43F0D8|nr:hypothetical protein [Mycobacteroides abscessus]